MANYSGIDKIDSFFAHYGRKGMKRGKNIFNPDYKPVGEVAKGPQAPGAKQSSGLAKSTIKSAPKSSATSAADRQREAMNRAAGAATAMGAANAEKSRREALLEAERKRQAKLDEDRKPSKKERNTNVVAEQQKAFTKDFIEGMRESLKENGMFDNATYNEHKKMWDTMTPTERGHNMKMIVEIMFAKGGLDISEITRNFGTNNEPWAMMSTCAAVAAAVDGYPDIISHAYAVARLSGNAQQVMSAERAKKTQEELTARKARENKNKKVSDEYLRELEYNSKKNGW